MYVLTKQKNDTQTLPIPRVTEKVVMEMVESLFRLHVPLPRATW